MDKVFIVTSGEYSDYHIEAVFSTREQAERWCDLFTSSKGYAADQPGVEEWDLDLLGQRGDDLKPYFGRMDKDGNSSEVEKAIRSYGFREKCPEMGFDVKCKLYGYVWAKDEQHAIKILNEKRLTLLAENKWPTKEGTWQRLK